MVNESGQFNGQQDAVPNHPSTDGAADDLFAPRQPLIPADAVPFDKEQAERFLAVLGKSGNTRARGFAHSATPAEKKKEIGAHKFDYSNTEMLDWVQQQGCGIYVVINEGGDSAKSITHLIGYFAEFDEGTIEEQWARVEKLMREPTIVVYSGGKSLQFYWVFVDPIEATDAAKAQWVADQEHIAAYLGSDKSIKDPSRVMRLPGAWYVGPDQKPIQQARIYENYGVKWTPKEVMVVVPLPASTSAPSLPLQGRAPQPAAQVLQSDTERTRRRMLDQLRQVPPRIPSSTDRPDATKDTRNDYTKLLWALAAEFGDAEAARLMKSHSPVWAEVEDLDEKCRDRDGSVNAASFFQVTRDHWNITNPPRAAAPVPGDLDELLGPAPQPAANGKASKTAARSAKDKLASIRAEADRIYANKDIPPQDRLFYLRDFVEGLGLPPREQELQRHIWEARSRAAGVVDIIKPGQKLTRTPQPWVWQGLIMLAAFTLIVALPKVGKTSMLLEFIRCWHGGELELFGQPICSEPRPVLIVGTDQPESDWTRMLDEANLLTADGELKPFIVGLATTERPIHLNSDGISEIASYAEAHPGLLIIVDSYWGCVRSLGIKDKDADFAEPLLDLQEAVSPFRASVVVIHHSGKTNAKESAVLASRGGTALPAAVSQIVGLNKFPKANPIAPEDPRVIVKSEGRAGNSIELLVEHVEATGQWVFHGDAADVEREKYLEEAEDSLTEHQSSALESVRHLWQEIGHPCTVADICGHLFSSNENTVRKSLKKLASLGLVVRNIGADTTQGPGRKGDTYQPPGAAGRPVLTQQPSGPPQALQQPVAPHQAAAPASPPHSTDWKPLAALIADQHPSWIAAQVANALMAQHDLSIPNLTIRDWLQLHRAGQR